MLDRERRAVWDDELVKTKLVTFWIEYVRYLLLYRKGM